MTSESPEPVPHPDPVPVRLASIDLFENIAFGDVTLDRAFADNDKFLALNTLDRALARMIVTTTIRRLGQIDDIISAAMNNPEKEPEPRLLLTLLRLSTAQIVFMNIPDHAAVNIAVNLAEILDLKRQKGLMNAVLRRVAREGKNRTTRQDIARLNIPGWMLDNWMTHFGKRTGLDIAYALMGEAPLDLSLKDPEKSSEIAKTLDGIILPTGTLRIRHPAGSVEQMSSFKEGLWWVQDAAAALPVKLMGDINGKTIVDLCAAPGGKTAQIAANGAYALAIDRSGPRLTTLDENLKRLNLRQSVTLIEADGTTWRPEDHVDGILIDAPCTATGTLRRNPDISLHRTSEDILRMSGIQTRLLENACTFLKIGGFLVYAVCSLQHEEGETQIDSFLKRHPNFSILPITPDEIGGWDMMITKTGTLRALPSHLTEIGGIDGFFAARLVKNK